MFAGLSTCPKCSPTLWDYCLQYSSKIWLCTEYNAKNQKGRTWYEAIIGNMPSNLEWIQLNNTNLCGSGMKYHLGLVKKESIEISHRVGQERLHFLLCKSGKVISRTSLFQPMKWGLLGLEFKATVEQSDKYISYTIDKVKALSWKGTGRNPEECWVWLF